MLPQPAPESRFADSLSKLSAWEHALGLKTEVATDAAGRLTEILAQGKVNLLIGGTPEGELILGRYTPYPDALFAGLMIAELVSRNAGNLQAMLDELRGQLGVVK